MYNQSFNFIVQTTLAKFFRTVWAKCIDDAMEMLHRQYGDNVMIIGR